jgi:L-alanine-DL-glutamate epimerase-like enolase superfamily enzyme
VAAALSIPVAGGEQDNDLAQWRRMVRLKAVDLIQPDICYVGGFTRAWQVAQIGAAAKLACVPHSANHSLVSVFTLHLLAAIANPGPHMEFSIEPNESARAIYEPALQVEAGQVAVPDGPGWGVRLRQPWLDAATRHVSA